MGGSIAPVPFPAWLNNNGRPASGYKLFTYDSGTSTKRPTYTNVGLTSAHTNPIIINSSGRTSSPIYLIPGVSYSFVFTTNTDTDPPVSPLWTADPVGATEQTNLDVDITGTAGESSILTGHLLYCSTGLGADSAKTAGRWYKPIASALPLGSVEANALGFALSDANTGETLSIRITGRVTNLAALIAGTLYYVGNAGAVTATPPAFPRPIGIADTSSSLVVSPWVPTADAAATWGGRVTSGAQTIGGAKTFQDVTTFSARPLGLVNFARSTAAFTKNANTTLSDVTGLAFAIAASEVYTFDFVLIGVSSAAADWKFAITFPAAVTAVQYGLVSDAFLAAGATSTAAGVIELATTGVERGIRISGLVRNGANAGSVQLQAAQLASDATNSIIRAESYVVAMRQA